jgi:hypothetical protein
MVSHYGASGHIAPGKVAFRPIPGLENIRS